MIRANWHTEIYGNAARKPVLFLHGFLGSGAEWASITKSTRNHYCICPDLPGHGKTQLDPGLEGYCFERVGHALMEHLNIQGIDHCAIVGYSMGARLALYLAAEYPGRFPAVVLESGSAGLRTEEEQDARKLADEGLAQRLEAIGRDRNAYRQFLEEWFQQPVFQTLQRRPELVQKLIKLRLKHDPMSLALALRGLGVGNQPSLWERLPRLKQPTLLIIGHEDSKFRQIAEDLCGQCKSMAMHSVDGCGHNVHLEDPDRYTALLWQFLSQVW